MRHSHWRRVGSRAAVQKLGSRVGLAQFHLLFPSLLAVRIPVTCKPKKTQQMAVDFNLFSSFVFRICFSLQIRRSFFGLCLHLLRFRCLAASRRNGRVWVAAGWSPIWLVAAAVGFCCRCPAVEGEAGLCAQRRRKGRPAGRGWEKCSGRLLFENGGCRCGAALDYGEAGSAMRGWAVAGRERRLRGAGFVLMRGRWDSVWGCWRFRSAVIGVVAEGKERWSRGKGLDYGRLSLVEGEEKNQPKGVGGLAAAVLGEGDES